ncbi:NAD(P)H-dependent flavin oxidoreductase [Glaciimonas immobilis]|uniref:Nitronate monooxygenase n=1 Tax=Glaciimonas immobilis TaxID=728004 RepID=A0A840RTC2_9BURK|nr:nitronate monooxygenase [Glaciimonas immobilis]KAF3996074.1 nitronate monooxygenase [Glaciimonas immobilis]MBB5201787.1 nitronate monooxygenase [Glaciimonas immobilis]
MSKALSTNLMRTLRISQPIILGPMLGAGTLEMLVGVTKAGGLGSLAVSSLTPGGISAAVAAIRSHTSGPFNVNLFVLDTPHPTDQELQGAFALLDPFRAELGLSPAEPLEKYCEDFREQLEMLIALKVPVASFTFGLLDASAIERLHDAGTLVIGTATNVAEARAWEANGADIICAQGAEAGGHRGTFIGNFDSSMIGTMALVPQIVDNVKVPVVAAGGIMDGRGIAAALMLGAQAVQMGTAFLSCAECLIHPAWKTKLREASDISTRITRSFSGRAARGIVNEYMQRMAPYENQVLAYPVQNALTGAIRQAAGKANRPEFLSLWASQATALGQRRKSEISVAELMEQLLSEFTGVLESVGR